MNVIQPDPCKHRKGSPIDKMQGADNPALEAKIKEHYEAVGWDGDTQSGVKVHIDYVVNADTQCCRG